MRSALALIIGAFSCGGGDEEMVQRRVFVDFASSSWASAAKTLIEESTIITGVVEETDSELTGLTFVSLGGQEVRLQRESICISNRRTLKGPEDQRRCFSRLSTSRSGKALGFVGFARVGVGDEVLLFVHPVDGRVSVDLGRIGSVYVVREGGQGAARAPAAASAGLEERLVDVLLSAAGSPSSSGERDFATNVAFIQLALDDETPVRRRLAEISEDPESPWAEAACRQLMRPGLVPTRRCLDVLSSTDASVPPSAWISLPTPRFPDDANEKRALAGIDSGQDWRTWSSEFFGNYYATQPCMGMRMLVLHHNERISGIASDVVASSCPQH